MNSIPSLPSGPRPEIGTRSLAKNKQLRKNRSAEYQKTNSRAFVFLVLGRFQACKNKLAGKGSDPFLFRPLRSKSGSFFILGRFPDRPPSRNRYTLTRKKTNNPEKTGRPSTKKTNSAIVFSLLTQDGKLGIEFVFPYICLCL